MKPEQFDQIKAKLMDFAELMYEQRARLLYYRALHEQDRIDRGHHLTTDEWPPRERRKRVKWEPEQHGKLGT